MIDLLLEILNSIRRNKMRTILTGFAVSWGIFMLIVLLGAGNGLLNAMNQRMEGLPMNIMETYPGVATLPYQGMEGQRTTKLTGAEMGRAATMAHVGTHIYPRIDQSGVILSHGKEYCTTTLRGIIEGYLKMNALTLVKGRDINPHDQQEQTKCIILHEKTAEMLFGNRKGNAVGKYVKAGSVLFKVVGIYTSEEMGSSEYSAYIPFSTLQTIYHKGNELNSLSFDTHGITTMAEADSFESAYRTMLSRTMHFDPADMSAVDLWNRFTSYLQMMTGNHILRTALWIIGILTLLSGIVGVSNIMLVNVKERKREFGIRKAIGAKPRQLLAMIIAESVIITTLFGYIGMVLGILTTEYMSIAAGSKTVDLGMGEISVFVNPTVDLHVAIQATLTLIIAGTLAGWIPARKAAHTQTIEALRAE